MELVHTPTGITGKYVKTTYPTGKPVTIVIQTDRGLYFAPCGEFIKQTK